MAGAGTGAGGGTNGEGKEECARKFPIRNMNVMNPLDNSDNQIDDTVNRRRAARMHSLLQVRRWEGGAGGVVMWWLAWGVFACWLVSCSSVGLFVCSCVYRIVHSFVGGRGWLCLAFERHPLTVVVYAVFPFYITPPHHTTPHYTTPHHTTPHHTTLHHTLTTPHHILPRHTTRTIDGSSPASARADASQA